MSSKKVFILAALMAVVFMAFGFQSTSEHKVLFEKAKFTMETKGNLKGAIKLFFEIIEKYPGEREYAAKSQLYIGLCYEKLGLKQAQMAFQKVIENYPEQAETVKLAREKLEALLRAQTIIGKGDDVFKIQKIWDNLDVRLGNLSSVSPDGRYVSFTDRHGGDLSILDLTTKKRRRLTDNFSRYEVLEKDLKKLSNKEKMSLIQKMKFATGSKWSPDGTKLVYGWVDYAGGGDLRIVRLDESQPHVLLRNEEFDFLSPLDWSSDGKHILAVFFNKDMKGQIALIKVTDGSVRVVKKFDVPVQNQGKSMLLPDGQYMVYDMAQEKSSSERDILLLSLYEGKEIRLVEHPADDFILGLSPDGKKLLFSSERRGTLDAWVLGIEGGQSQGEPKLVKKNLGEIGPIGFDRKGSFYYGMRNWVIDVFTATLDREKAIVQTPPAKATKSFEGTNLFPAWSPDGKFLAFVSRRLLGSDYSWFLRIQSIETGEERELLLPDLKNLRPTICWSPDGRSIVATGSDDSGREGIYEIDVNSGNLRMLKTFDSDTMKVRWPTWSPDKKKLFFKIQDNEKSKGIWSRLMVYDTESGQVKELFQEKSWPTLMALSPDGQWLAFQTLDLDTLLRSLNVMPSAGGEPRKILTLGENEFIFTVAWMPDGESLVFAKSNNQKKNSLWQISIEEGQSQKLGLEMQRLRLLSVHPDGQRIAFCSSQLSITLWVMENFLPNLKDKK